ncbi:YdcF family protein [bacterium]|nr:YdcF family protein [bacterium]
MLHDEDIICFSSIDWDFNWQGHQQIMHSLAAAGNRVLFVENTGVRAPRLGDYNRLVSRLRNWRSGYKGIRQVEENLFVFSPLLLPFPYSRAARWLNRVLMLRVIRSWCRSVRFSRPLVWSFLPSALTREVTEALEPRLVVYYCIDSFADSSSAATRIRGPEQEMLRRADLVFVTSEKLREHCSEHNAQVHKFPFTVDYEPFARVRDDSAAPEPEDMRGLEGPILGYVGGLHRWVDQELLVGLARLMPECHLVLVGPEQEPADRLRAEPNIHLLGGKPHSELPLYLKRFTVGLVPYLRTAYTDNVYPTKLNEYLAMGLPVLSTPIREAGLFARENPGMLDLCPDAESMARAVRERLAVLDTEQESAARLRRHELARLNAWPERIERMCDLIGERLAELRTNSGQGWRQNLRTLLGAARRRLVVAASLLLLIYATLYLSPLVYWLGRPLSHADPAVCSDVILVFGGGVGETGRPGSSTFERAAAAVEMYHRGLAPRIVFSSGYQQYTGRDVENMLRISVADSVPMQDIILETSSANNYGNVAGCLALMDSLGCRSALVVTGTVNGLRSRLIFDHLLRGQAFGGIRPDSIRLAPIRQSVFFDPVNGDRGEQWQAVLHEYQALVWYWWKDWI